MKILKVILKYKYFYTIFFVIVLLLSLLRISIKKMSVYQNDYDFILKVSMVKQKDEKYTIYFDGKERLISYCDDFPYDVGDILRVNGNLESISNNTIPNLFNYKRYLENEGIFYELKIKKMNIISKNNSIINRIKTWIKDRIESQKNKEYIYAFILGDTSYLKNEIRDIYQNNGIIYLFSIGFMQVAMLTFFLEKIKEYFRIKEKYYIGIVFIVFLIYLIIVNMKIGILRGSLCYLIKRIAKYKKITLKYSDIILLTGCILLIFKPNYLNNVGFYYSYIVSFGISKYGKCIKGNFIKRVFLISILANILSFPINIFNNYKINILASVLSTIFSPFTHFILYPLCIISFIIPGFNGILSFFISLLEDINILIGNIDVLSIVFRKPSIFVIIIYYFIIILINRNKKFLIIFMLTIIIHLNINKIMKEKFVMFLDVGQGDSIVLKDANNVYLIDTGGNVNINYSDNIIKYLNSLGIGKINGLILTHGDYDHMGEAVNFVNNFKVEKVIFNCGEYNDLEKELIKVLDKKKIKYYSCIKELNTDNNKLSFLQTNEYKNENDNSNVIYTEFSGYKFMFMGDASITTEKEILNKYNLPNIDVLKVGHHGSKTSSSIEFINDINPKYSIISVGKNNRYGHPNKEVLDNLENSNIYRTDIDGSIMFKIKNNRLKIETCSP